MKTGFIYEENELGALVNHGFNEEDVVIEQEAYILGSTSKLPNIVYREDSQWPEVAYEPQASKYETSGCTVWGSETQIEMFTKAVYGVEPNYDERFTYLNANVTLRGANPQDVYESIRHDGLIDNEPLPETYDEFSDRAYLTPQRIKSGQEWKDKKFELYHHWLDNTSKETIVEELKYSPIGLSVTAWYQDEEGLYESRGQMNTHWCVCFGYLKEWKGKPGIYLKIFDSYDHSVKILHPDHRIAFAKRIFLRKREDGDNEIIQGTFYSLWVNGLLSFFADFIQSFKKQKEPIPVPEPPKVLPKPNYINAFAKAIEIHEGYYEGSRSYRNNNPANAKYVGQPDAVGQDAQGFAIFPTYQVGFDYLCRVLRNACEGKSKVYSPEMDLYDFFAKYAPREDNNDPIHYANTVANFMGIDATTQLKNLL